MTQHHTRSVSTLPIVLGSSGDGKSRFGMTSPLLEQGFGMHCSVDIPIRILRKQQALLHELLHRQGYAADIVRVRPIPFCERRARLSTQKR